MFYSWVQVRNYGALDKINHEKAENHDRTVTLTKAFAAWRYAMELVETKPLNTLRDLKSSPPAQSTVQATSLSKSSRSQSALVETKPLETWKQLKRSSPSQPNMQPASVSNSARSQFTLMETKPLETKPTASLSKSLKTQSTPSIRPLQTTSRSEAKTSKEEAYLAWLNKYLKPIGEQVNDLGESVASGVYVLRALGEASGKKVPRYHECAILPLQRMSNWKLVTDFMKELGINVRGIEAEDLTNNNVACLYNMFANILKWDAKRL